MLDELTKVGAELEPPTAILPFISISKALNYDVAPVGVPCTLG